MDKWSRNKGSKNEAHYIELNCSNCGNKFVKEKGYYDNALKRRPNQKQWFCSVSCINTNREGRNISEETRIKIVAAQKGISCPSRGRIGHIVSEETREKIRQSRLGQPSISDHDIILQELAYRGTPKYAITRYIIPDAIFIEDGHLVALELEKKKWETDIRRKMKSYENSTDYDKVVLVWYSPKGERLKEWHKDNGEWKLVSS
jgi:hypothetical protein